MKLLKFLSIGALLGAILFSSASDAQIPGLLNQGNVLGNATGSPAEARPVTPQTARGPLLLNIDELTRIGDANYTILPTDRSVAHTALLVARTDTLPAANSVNAGQTILVIDLYGVVTGIKTLTITRAGSDTINGSTSAVLSAANGGFIFISDGISAWSAQGVGSTTTVGVTSLGGSTGTIGVTNGLDIAGSNLEITSARRTLPTRCVILSTTATTCSNGGSQANNGTYTTPANVLWLEVVMVGGGSGGGGGNNAAVSGVGGNTTFNGGAFQANGAAGSNIRPGGGGSTLGCAPGFSGGSGGNGFENTPNVAFATGGVGASTIFGGGASGGLNTAGAVAPPNTGAGGGGGGTGIAQAEFTGAGGSAGGSCFFIINSPSVTYTYAVGTGGVGGSPGSDGFAGGNGAAGIIIITEHYGT